MNEHNLQDFDLKLIDIDEWLADQWFSGPPPSIGWWPASTQRAIAVVRWWNGVSWSWPCGRDNTSLEIRLLAEVESGCQATIEWHHRPHDWPENSRT